MAVPPCVGHFELGDKTCNGDPAGATEQDRMPCAWRNRCAGLQLYTKERGVAPEVVVASSTTDELAKLCQRYADDHAIEDGVVGGRQPPPPKKKRVVRSPQNKSKRPVTRPMPPINDEVRALHDHFEQTLRDFFPDRRFASGQRVLVKPGTFYSIDRLRGSQYISWYCTVAKGRDRALACVRFKPGLVRLDIQLPASVEELKSFLGARLFKRLQPKPFIDGQFKSVCMHLDREGVAECAEVLRRLVESDVVALP
jgi:hypothetical protein